MQRVVSRILILAVTGLVASERVPADEAAIVAGIEAFFATDNAERRVAIAAGIEADAAYGRDRMPAWLHQADLFKPMKGGRQTLRVPLADGTQRTVVLRIPKDYRHRQPYPVIYALHGANGRGDHIIGYVQQLLGDRIDEYVVAAPDQYEERIIHQRDWPPNDEHRVALRAVKRAVHVDSERVYLLGYSMGGHASWTTAVLHADQFAGAMPLAGTFSLILADHLWEVFLPNLQNLPVLCVWGQGDIYSGGDRISPDGGIAGINSALVKVAGQAGLPVEGIELADRGHSDVMPPPQAVAAFFARRRVAYPKSVRHTFRHLSQGSAYWLEAVHWAGPEWERNQIKPRFRDGESPNRRDDFDRAVARTFRGLLAEISGEIEGQTIRVRRRKVRELTVWIGAGLIDWTQPVHLDAGGARRDFDGRLTPSVYVCLSQAARTWDFDRLRWAGLRVSSRAATRPVEPDRAPAARGE